MMTDDSQQKIAQLLHRLGINENYKGFSPTVYAVQLTISDPNRLQLVTKLIYLDTAKQYGTTWNAIERNLRTIAGAAWEKNGVLLSDLAGVQLHRRPSNARFLAILAHSCTSDR